MAPRQTSRSLPALVRRSTPAVGRREWSVLWWQSCANTRRYVVVINGLGHAGLTAARLRPGLRLTGWAPAAGGMPPAAVILARAPRRPGWRRAVAAAGRLRRTGPARFAARCCGSCSPVRSGSRPLIHSAASPCASAHPVAATISGERPCRRPSAAQRPTGGARRPCSTGRHDWPLADASAPRPASPLVAGELRADRSRSGHRRWGLVSDRG
jgi:hypothetical protein